MELHSTVYTVVDVIAVHTHTEEFAICSVYPSPNNVIKDKMHFIPFYDSCLCISTPRWLNAKHSLWDFNSIWELIENVIEEFMRLNKNATSLPYLGPHSSQLSCIQ